MPRGIGGIEPIQDAIPEWAAILVALLTQLGDAWFLALLIGGLYWFRATDREETAVVAGLALAGFALITTLKHVFALPRPAQPLVAIEALPGLLRPLYELTGTASGYGFPSGHALMSTVVYVSLARRLSIGSARRRLLAASTLVGLVCLSRIALGVHYLVDVLAGVGVGLAFLFAAERLLDRGPTDRGTTAFALAIGLSTIAVVASGVHVEPVLLFVGSLGLFGGWQWLRSESDRSQPA